MCNEPYVEKDYKMTPEFPSTSTPASKLADQQILDLLEELGSRPATTHEDDEALISAIADLELEAAKRAIEVPGPHERIPPAVALDRFKVACTQGDFEAAGKAVYYLDPQGLWYAYRRAREQGHIAVQLHLLVRVRICVELGVLGMESTRARGTRLDQADLSDEDSVAYMVQCIDALFTLSIINMDLPY
jgi:hypothetical protein